MRVVVGALLLVCGCAQIWGFDETSASATCEVGRTHCGGTCVDTLSALDHCGECDNACEESQVCGNGVCTASCPIDQMECSGMCSDLQTDAANCGGCGMACTGGDVCVFGECEPPCDPSQLMAAVTDSWGIQWDGLERSAAALDVALVTCDAFGGRLPTATELFRVAANQSGGVGMSFHTNYLWTQTAIDRLDQATVRLSDGATSSVAAATPSAYRCVCPAPLPKTFTGNHCNGDPTAPCFELNGYHIDTRDRPALRKAAAVRECMANRAHLVDAPLLAEAIRAGLPGTNEYVMTADQASYQNVTQLRWMNATWEPNANVTAIDNRNASIFRCAASKLAQSPNPHTIANAFVPTGIKYIGETQDNAATTWATAHDTCTMRGGHLPRSTELSELIMQGMPGGTNAYLWTSDQTGFNGTQFLAATQRWTAVDPRYNYVHTGGGADQTLTWDYKTGMQASRCIYYPLDTAYVAPTACAGGCFEVTTPGGATMWLDSEDRALTTLGAAFDDCRSAGGHLASNRDLTEAIRARLPNGSAAMDPPWLFTSDFAQGNVTIVRWTSIEPDFTDQYSTYMTWTAPNAMYRYRCMWTNELR